MVLKLILLSAGLLFIAMLAMSVGIFFRKDHQFPEHRVGHNRAMRKKKIYCARTQDAIDRKNYFKKLNRKEDDLDDLFIANPESRPKMNLRNLKPILK